jgi:SAM-dependent methyltransferase
MQNSGIIKSNPKKLHLGCGLNTPEGWINLDGSWNAWLAKYPILREILGAFHILSANQLNIPWRPDILIHNFRKPLPFEDNSLQAIYASHLLEHLYFEETKRLLNECFRVLRSGGILRMIVPDLQAIVMEYMGQKHLSSGDSPDEMESCIRADRLNKKLLLCNPKPPSGNFLYRFYISLQCCPK